MAGQFDGRAQAGNACAHHQKIHLRSRSHQVSGYHRAVGDWSAATMWDVLLIAQTRVPRATKVRSVRIDRHQPPTL